MDYYGLLFLYYLKGLSGKSILRLFFNIEVGGTEQLLPENTSVPTTSPILADIQYPDEFRTDQYFTYRETPTTVSNKARIKTIKGNTLGWNQLVQNGDFASASGWGINGGTLSVANNIATLTANETVAYVQIYRDGFTLNTSHRYLIKFNYNATNITNFLRAIVNSTDGSTYVQLGQNTSNSGTLDVIVTPSLSATRLMFAFVTNGNASGSGTISNVQVFDLTQMDLDITDPSEFTSLFSLPYYDFNQGSLLSFNGTWIKTVGKNQLKMPSSATLNGISFNVGTDGQIQITGTATAQTDFYLYGASGVYNDMGIMSSAYMFSCHKDSTTTGLNFFLVGQQTGTKIGVELNNTSVSQTVALDGSDKYRVFMRVNNGATINTKVVLQLELGASVTDYEPYTSSTLSLPISTYFPTGMKSAGSVYDELTPMKAITKIGAVDLGSLTWDYDSGVPRFYSFDIQNIARKPESASIKGNILCSKYITETIARLYLTSFDHVIALSNTGSLNIKDTNYNSVETLKNSLQGVYLYYELATPTETPITTEDANEALSLLMGRSVSSNNANQLIDIITKGE